METATVKPHDNYRYLGGTPREGPGEGTMTAIACLIVVVVFSILALCFSIR